MSDQFSEIGRVMFASEATEGVDEIALILADGARDIVYQACEEASIKSGLTPILRKRVIGTAERVVSDVYKDGATLKLKIPLGSSIAAAVGDEAPYYSDLLQACGFKETINAGTGSEYDLATAQQSSLTCYVWLRNTSDDLWRLRRITGARGTLKLVCEVGKEAMIEAELTGQYVDLESDPAEYFDATTFAIKYLADGSTAVAVRTSGTETWAAQAGAICEAMTYTLAAGALDIGSLEVKTGRAVQVTKAMTSSQATLRVALMVGEGPGGSYDLMDGGSQLTTVRTAILAKTESALVCALTKGARTITISGPQAQMLPYEPGDNSGVQKYAVPFGLNRNFGAGLVGDNSLKFAYT